MIIKFDSLNRVEPPSLILCNPGCELNSTTNCLTSYMGVLNDTEALEFVFNFNEISEINFRINDIRAGYNDTEYEYISGIFNSVLNRRLIYAENIGFFIITNVTENFDEDGGHSKDVKAESAEIEMQQKMIPYIEDGTYRFSSDNAHGVTGLLETVVSTIPYWTIGHVDNSVAIRYRTFEGVDTSLNCLGFMMDNMQEAYECIFLFDILQRTINVYDQSTYVKETSIHLTREDMIRSGDVTENSSDLYTALTVLGANDETMTAVNPLGTNTVYRFDYYLDWMSPSLKEKIIAWQNNVKNSVSGYTNANKLYYEWLEKESNSKSEITRLDTQLDIHLKCKGALITNAGDLTVVGKYNTQIVKYGGQEIDVTEDAAAVIASVNAAIKKLRSDKVAEQKNLVSIQKKVGKYKNAIDNIHNSLSLTSTDNFTAAEQAELNNYIFEGNMTDEYIVITDEMNHEDQITQMSDMYNRALNQLNKVSMPTQEYKINANSFVFEKSFSFMTGQLETGCLINVELISGEIALLFLTNITINYDDKDLSLTFGNKYNKYDPRTLFKDLLGNITKTANSLSYIKDVLYPIRSGEFDSIRQILQTSRNLTMLEALSSDNQEVVIDDSGYTGRRVLTDGTFDPHQIKITANNILFTDDNWESCKTAIGKIKIDDSTSVYGVNAEVLIGDMILSEDLEIVNDSGTISLNNSGISLIANQDNSIEFSIGKRVTNSDGSTSVTKSLYVDENGDVVIENGKISWGSINGAPTIPNTSNLYKSITPLYYKTDGDKPEAPTTKITSIGTGAGAWKTAAPTYTKGYKIYTCIQYETNGGTLSCSPVVEYVSGNIATEITKNTVTTSYVNALRVTAKDLIADAVISNHITCSNIDITGGKVAWSAITGAPTDTINASYKSVTTLYYKTSGDKPDAPTTKITSAGTGADAWKTAAPTYSKGCKTYTCTQYETNGGTLSWSPVVEYVSSAISTEITKDTITTSYINALNVTAKYISSDLVVSNQLNVTSGVIGNWKIGAAGIYNDVTSGTDTYRTCIYAPEGLTTSKLAFYVRKTDSDSKSTYPFYVSYGGDLHSTSGDIGGWTIGSTSLYSTGKTSTGKTVGTGIQVPTSGVYAIAVGYTGSSGWGDAPFKVTHEGSVTASNINITGGSFYLSDTTADDPKFKIYNNTREVHMASGWIYVGDHTASLPCSSDIDGDGFKSFYDYNTNRRMRAFLGLGSATKAGYGYLINESDTQTIQFVGSTGVVSATSWNTTSDIRFKRKVSDLSENEAGLILGGLNPFNYKWRQSDSNAIETGLSAQELRDILKENDIGYRGYLIIRNLDDDYSQTFDIDSDEDRVIYGIDYSKLVSVLVKGWQMHEAKISELESQIKELKEL